MIELSIVMPCKNEGDNIRRTLTALKSNIPMTIPFEIIVVDNDSDDDSGAIALEFGCRVVKSSAKTIASVRNKGVNVSKGKVLCFIDCDVEVTKQWGHKLKNVIERIKKERFLIIGSHCSVPYSNSLINKYWFKAIEINSSSHVGSGHMFLSRDLFNTVGGFDESYMSGEDYHLCSKVKKLGGRVIEDQELKVYHHDFPRNIKEFFIREMWHGKGDWKNIRTILSSKVLMVSFINLGLIIILIFSIFINFKYFMLLSILYAVFLIFTSCIKFPKVDSLRGVLIRSVIMPVYLLARSLSPFYK